jgi:hypothetical protein
MPVRHTTRSGLETRAQFSFSTTRPAPSTMGIVSKLADLATARKRKGASISFASAERDAVPDDGTDHQRDCKPAQEADGKEVWPVHRPDHDLKSKHTHRLEGVLWPECLSRDRKVRERFLLKPFGRPWTGFSGG